MYINVVPLVTSQFLCTSILRYWKMCDVISFVFLNRHTIILIGLFVGFSMLIRVMYNWDLMHI